MYYRKQLTILKNRLLEPRKFIQIIVGPRQIGKTTLIKQLKNETNLYIDYVSADVENNPNNEWIRTKWNGLRLKIKSSTITEVVFVIDEVQKIHNWSESIKSLWDEDSFNDINIKLVLLGSSQMLIQKGFSESLMGRFELIRMEHWTYKEMHEAFGFSEEQFLWFGGYPGGAELINDENRWKEYIQNSLIESTLLKDILLLTRIDKPVLVQKLFEIGCSYSGQIVSYRKILGQLDDAGNATTLANYLNLLDSAGMLCGIEKFSLEKIRRKASSPKWQVHNNALLSVLSGNGFQKMLNNPKLFGRFVESAIGTHLLNQRYESGYKLYYWRDSDLEVDFVLVKNNKVIAIEVKSGITQKISGLKEFVKRFSPFKTYLVGKSGLLWNDFLKIDVDNLF